MRFFRQGRKPLKVVLDLAGDFHDDIRGKVIRFKNPKPSDENDNGNGTFMEGFSRVQRGQVGDITAGIPLGLWTKALAQKLMAQNELIWDKYKVQGREREKQRQEWAERYRKQIEAREQYFCYVDYPYIEWYSEKNGRVVLEFEPSQVKIIESEGTPPVEKTPEELVEDKRKRSAAMVTFLADMVRRFSGDNRKQPADGSASG